MNADQWLTDLEEKADAAAQGHYEASSTGQIYVDDCLLYTPVTAKMVDSDFFASANPRTIKQLA